MKDVVKYLYEVGGLKNVKRSGWWVAGVKDPESVAEHSHRAAIVAYVIARLEKTDAPKAMMMTLLHDMGEVRILDLHKISQRYIETTNGEFRAFKEQVSRLPKSIGDEFVGLYSEYKDQTTKEGVISKDADLIEVILQAKEYVELGYPEAKDWIQNAGPLLKTKTAKKMLKEILRSKSSDWWKGLKNVKR